MTAFVDDFWGPYVAVVKPWIATRITELMGVEDDVVILFVITQLEEGFKVGCCKLKPR